MTAVTDRTRSVEDRPMELLYEVAVRLLPLIGRCVEVAGDEPVSQHGNRLDSVEDRRLVIADVARRWSRLDDATRISLGPTWQAAVAAFTVAYVDEVEAQEAGPGEYEQRRHEVTMALVWRQHAERLSADPTLRVEATGVVR
jgi:hypothetical protein